MDWAKLVKESYAETSPDARPFILMRAGYSGAQRNGLVPWSGDVSKSWGGLQSQPDIVLQMGLQGIAFMHSDLGYTGSKGADGTSVTILGTVVTENLLPGYSSTIS